jgi:hypothetical protein
MSASEFTEIDAVLGRVQTWPASVQLSLATRILESLEASNALASGPKDEKPLRSLLGLLATNGQPPSDDECQQIIAEERLRKYG